MTETRSSTDRPIIDSLTGLRGVAALWVLLLHTSPFISYPSWLQRIALQGPAGVSLFFVLSGFVLTVNYQAWFESDTSAWRRFARARVARIVPVYLFGLLIGTASTLLSLEIAHEGLILHLHGNPSGVEWIGAWLLHAAGVLAWVPSTLLRDLWNPPAWSVSTELAFYAAFPFIVRYFTARLTTWRSLVLAWLIPLAIQVTVAGALLVLAWRRYSFDGAFVRVQTLVYQVPVMRLSEFIAGCVLALVYVRTRSRPELSPGLLEPGRQFARNAILVAALVWIAVVIPLDVIVDAERDTSLQVVMDNLRYHSFYVPGFSALILVLALGPTVLHRILESRPMQALGFASYALYIVHWPILQPVLMREIEGRPVSRTVAVGVVALVFVVAFAVHRFVEVPARKKILGRAPPLVYPAGEPAGDRRT